MTPPPDDRPPSESSTTPLLFVLLAWLFVGAPLVWGVLQTLKKASALFQ